LPARDPGIPKRAGVPYGCGTVHAAIESRRQIGLRRVNDANVFFVGADAA
jgi:hypothetical protein